MKLSITVNKKAGGWESKTFPISENEVEIIKPLIERIKGFTPYGAGLSVHYNDYPVKPRIDLGEEYPEEIYKNLENSHLHFRKYMLLFPEYFGITKIEVI